MLPVRTSLLPLSHRAELRHPKRARQEFSGIVAAYPHNQEKPMTRLLMRVAAGVSSAASSSRGNHQSLQTSRKASMKRSLVLAVFCSVFLIATAFSQPL